MQMGRSPGTGLGTTDLEDSRVFLRWTTEAYFSFLKRVHVKN